jgi:hypothetical protein
LAQASRDFTKVNMVSLLKVTHYIVYKLTCLLDGRQVEYYGSSGVLKGQSDKACSMQRKSWHILRPVYCLMGADKKSFKITVVKTGLTLDKALADEALLAARQYCESENLVRGDRGLLYFHWCPENVCRRQLCVSFAEVFVPYRKVVHQWKQVAGGPWCQKQLPTESRALLRKVAQCKSRAGVWEVAKKAAKSNVLKLHLKSEKYSRFWKAHPVTITFPPPSRSGTRTSGWLNYRKGEKPGGAKWPSNWEAMPAWKAANLGVQ